MTMESKTVLVLVGIGLGLLTGCSGASSGDDSQSANGVGALSSVPGSSPGARVAPPLPPEGGDSAWALCNSSFLALNTFEHRAANGEDRNTDYVMLYGGYVLTGTVVNAAPEASMHGMAGQRSAFSGTVVLDDATNTAEVHGTLTLSGTAFSVSETLKCTTMGH
jgi:hypothetical protein